MSQPSNRRALYIGSFTTGSAKGQGISLARQDPDTGELTLERVVAEAESPAFLAWHPNGRRLYAVTETSEAAVTAYAVENSGALRALGSQPTGGRGACHLVVHPSGRYVLVANYGSGSVSVHPIRDDGTLSERTDLVQHSGSGPNTSRQEGPHAHHVRVTPDGQWVLAVDLGLDAIFTYTLDIDRGELRPGPQPQARTTPGAGPRHLTFHPDGRHVHVAGELSSQVLTFNYDAEAGALDLVGTATSTVEPAGADNYPSEIALSEDGQVCYVANRGRDWITTLAVNGRKVTPMADVATGGEWPRHLAVVGEHLYVANERSHEVTHFRLDADTGVPTLVSRIETPSPACVLPAPLGEAL